VIFAM